MVCVSKMNACTFFLLVISGGIVQSLNCSKGTTPHLKDIILGRCQYQQLKKVKDINCTTLWSAFYHGFAFKNPCAVSQTDYEPFFDIASREPIVNKSLFWSGTYKAVHDYADFDLRYTTLEDTLEGSMMNNLCWCGNPANTSDGIDYKSCPDCARNVLNSTKAFWDLASKRFAERARGVVRVMLNGTRVGYSAYNRSSTFGQYELPSLKVSTIIMLKILVVHTIGEKHLESCDNGSIQLLIKDAKKRGIKQVKCVNDQNDVKHILCSHHPRAEECAFRGNVPEPNCRLWEIIVIVLAVLLFVAILALVVVLSILCHKRHEDKTKKTALEET